MMTISEVMDMTNPEYSMAAVISAVEDGVSRFEEMLRSKYAELSQYKCSFLISHDHPGGSKYATNKIRDRVILIINTIFQNTCISIKQIEHTSAAVKREFSQTECICGYIYIGHANNEKPPRLIFSSTDSIAVKGKPPYRHAYTEIDNSNLVSGNVSALFGCNSSSTFFEKESIAEVLSRHFGGDVLGSNRGLNYTNDGKAVRSTIAALKPEFPLWRVSSHSVHHSANERCKCKNMS